MADFKKDKGDCMTNVVAAIDKYVSDSKKRDQAILIKKTSQIKDLSLIAEELIRMMKHEPDKLTYLHKLDYMMSGDVPLYINVTKLFECAAKANGISDYWSSANMVLCNMDILQEHFDFGVFNDVFGIDYEIKIIESEYLFVKKNPNLSEYIQYKIGTFSIRDILFLSCIPIFGWVLFTFVLYYVGKYYLYGVSKNAN